MEPTCRRFIIGITGCRGKSLKPPSHAAHTVVMGVCECEVHIISRLQ